MMLARLFALYLLAALPLHAEEVVAGLSQARVSITANFAGSEILVFGAVKREAPIPEDAPLDVIITVAGPSDAVIVRRKARRFGIWVNTDAVEIDTAPSFYAVSSTAPLVDILSDTEDLRHKISIPRAIRAIGNAGTVDDTEEFNKALMRIRTRSGLYQLHPGTIELTEETLFRGGVALPSNLTVGDYTTRIFLVRGGEVIDAYETTLPVNKVGLERWIYTLAHEKPLIYGILSLIIAIVAGWGASTVFRYIRG